MGFNAEGNFLVFFLEYTQSMFTECSGGERRRNSSVTHPGGGGPPEIVTGPTEYGQVTIRKPYDPVVDAPLDAWALAYDNGIEYRPTLVKIPVTSDGAPLPAGKPTTYRGCALISYKSPDVRKGSAEPQMLEITLQPKQVT